MTARSTPMFTHEQSLAQQQQLVREIFLLVSKRSDTVCNFLEGGRYDSPRSISSL